MVPFAHRGGALDNPENTIEAFAAAIDMGYSYMETDVHASADGVLFAFHDPHLGRVTNTQAYIGDLFAKEIDSIKVQEIGTIPRMEDLLASWPQAKFNIDIKSDAAILPMEELIKTTGCIDKVCVSSFFDHRIQHHRKRFGPRLCTSMGKFEVTKFFSMANGLLAPASFEAACAQLPFKMGKRIVITEKTVELAHEVGLDLHVWTVNDADSIQTMIAAKVDGIMTDSLAVLRDNMIEANLWPTKTAS